MTRFEYDGHGRIVEEIDPLGRSRHFAYDPAGQLTRVTDRNGRVTEFSYNSAGHRVTERWLDARGALVQSTTLSYNLAGQLTAVNAPGSSYTLRYDAKGRITQVSNLSAPGGAFTHNYTYDASDNVVKVTDSRGVEVNSTYDISGLLATRGWQGGPVAPARIDLGYDPLGQVTSVQRYTGSTGNQLAGRSSVQYDHARRVSGMAHQNAASVPLAQYSYNYDAMNLVERDFPASLRDTRKTMCRGSG